MGRDAFSGYHPAANLMFFAVTVLVTILIMNPIILAISFISSFCYSIYLNGAKAIKFNIVFVLPLMVISTAINVLFSHAGVTTLGYIHGNPITLESIVFGVAAATMMASVIMWFSCYNRIVTSDKFLFIFGEIIPSLALIVSMTLRFIPRYKVQMSKIIDAKRGMEWEHTEDTGSETAKAKRHVSMFSRMREGGEMFSSMLTWSLENSVDTADSMRARGYGTGKRTNYGNYEIEVRDIAVMTLFLIASASAIIGLSHSYQYYPVIEAPELSALSLIGYGLFFFASFTPILLGLIEEINWRRSVSKI